VHDQTSAAKDNGVLVATARHKDFRIPKSSVLESASEEKCRTIQIPAAEAEDELASSKLGCGQAPVNDLASVV